MSDRDLSQVTVEQWRAGIITALNVHDVKGVAALVHGMAVYHPQEADDIRHALLLGVAISTGEAIR